MSNPELPQTIVAGPCAAESEAQAMETAEALAKAGIRIIRLSLNKPRTSPGFDGFHQEGIPWLAKVSKELGVTVATEVLTPKDAMDLLAIFDLHPEATVWPWLGSRNQNHVVQTEIGRIIHERYPLSTKVILKNQPWPDQKHFLGIPRHVQKGGLPLEQMFLCHRGFYPNGNNPRGLRNVPDHEMAMKAGQDSDLPVIFDASHVGGRWDLVVAEVRRARDYPYAGYMIEVHPDPQHALTDAQQQGTPDDFIRDILPIIRNGNG